LFFRAVGSPVHPSANKDASLFHRGPHRTSAWISALKATDC